MLISHRRHRCGVASVSVDRAIDAHSMVRHVELVGLVQDERLTKPLLGVDAGSPRDSMIVVLSGELEQTIAGRSVPLRAGQGMLLPASLPYAGRFGTCRVLEWEWDAAGPLATLPPEATTLRFGPSMRALLASFAERLHVARGAGELTEYAELVAALASEGLRPRLASGLETAPAAQLLMDGIDAALNNLEASPMLVDFAGRSRRTLTRTIPELHARHGLLGRGASTSWRAYRDVYRLVIASLFTSSSALTTQEVARLAGYGSVEALHHGFRRVRLPSPAALRHAVRVG